MRTSQLEGFIRVARESSFSKAARALYVSQSTLTQQIASLEKELGFQLFVRSSRKVEITEAGQEFFKRSCSLLAELNEAIDDSRRIAEPLEKGISIGHPDFLSLTLRMVLRKFIEERPGLSFQLVLGTPRELFASQSEGNLDLVFVTRADLPRDGQAEFQPLLEGEFRCAVSAQSEFTRQSVLKGDDLSHLPLYVPQRKSYSPFYDDLYLCHKRQFPRASISEESDIRVIRSLVALGKAVAVVPFVPGEEETDDIICVPLVPRKAVEIGMVYGERIRSAEHDRLKAIVNSMHLV